MENFLSDNQTVGTLLKEERERQGKSIADVAEATHIRQMFLEYIEEDRFEDLPSKLHITGFLNVYSHFLGLSEQYIMTRYKKQMLLLGEMPSEEIFAISKNSLEKKSKNPLFPILGYSLILLVVAVLVMFFIFRKKTVPEEKNILENKPLEIILKRGDDFSFYTKGRKVHYQLLDITGQSLTLVDADKQIDFPPFLYSEALEVDFDNNQEYDFMIYAKEKKQDEVILRISPIRISRNPGQDTYAIVQTSFGEEIKKDNIFVGKRGLLSVKNNGKHDLFLILMSKNGTPNFNKILPQQQTQLSYFDDNMEPLYSSIFLQDIASFSLDLDGSTIESSATPGTVGVVFCFASKSSQKEEDNLSCKITEGV